MRYVDGAALGVVRLPAREQHFEGAFDKAVERGASIPLPDVLDLALEEERPREA